MEQFFLEDESTSLYNTQRTMRSYGADDTFSLSYHMFFFTQNLPGICVSLPLERAIKGRGRLMQSPSGSIRLGASLSLLGAILSISSNVIMSGIHPASLGSQILWLVLPPALIILGMSAYACLRTLPRWLLRVQCGVCILGFLLQLLTYLAHQALACFDMCHPETDTRIGFWLLVGLGGFLLSGIEAFVMLNRSRSRKA